MKTLLLAIVFVVGVHCAYAQGLVNAGNNNQTKISTNSYIGGPATGLTAATAGLFYYALFYSTTQTTVGGSTAGFAGTNGVYVFNSAGWADAGIIATNSGVFAGRLQSTTADSSSVTVLPNVGQVVAAQFVYIGWSANVGSTVASLMDAMANPWSVAGPIWFGESGVSGAITTGNGGTQATPLIFSTGAPQIPGFTLGLVSIPEPGVLSLAALGGVSLVLLRRRK